MCFSLFHYIFLGNLFLGIEYIFEGCLFWHNAKKGDTLAKRGFIF